MCALGECEVQMGVFNSPACDDVPENILLNIHGHTVVVSQSLGMCGFDDFQVCSFKVKLGPTIVM